MKYLHKPKTAAWVLFIISVVVCLLCNFVFLLEDKSAAFNDVNNLLFFHLLLPLSMSAIILFVSTYLIFCIEKRCAYLSREKYLAVMLKLKIVDIVLGIALLILASGNSMYFEKGSFYEKWLSESIYFRAFEKSETSSNIYAYWWIISWFTVIIFSVILFLSAARKAKICKTLKLEIENCNYKNRVNCYLGFDYELCEFYKQTQIPYNILSQMDGTRGEFEAYHMLISGGLTDAEYVFNREIPKKDGLFTELDLIVIHKNGIIVIENKHYTVRFFGKACDYNLTIIDHAGYKKNIYNPIRQNEKHVLALREFLKAKGLYSNDIITPIYSVVVFTAEYDDISDDIISGIDMVGTKTQVCTSRNLPYIVKKLLSKHNADIDVIGVKELLSGLSIRRKQM